MRLFVFLSEILGRRIYDTQNRYVGKICDVSMRLNDEVFPRAEYFIVRKGLLRKQYVRLPVEDLVERRESFELTYALDDRSYQSNEFKPDFSLGHHVLDQQVVDTQDQKVVRVNDVHLLRIGNQFYLAHVDVGLRGLVRRLEWDRFIDRIVRWVAPRSPYLSQEELISWRYSQVLTLGSGRNVLRSSMARQKLSRIPPTQLAEIMEDLDMFEKMSLFKSFSFDLQRKVFTDMAPPEKEEVIEQLSDREAANLVENIPADEATDLLALLPKEKVGKWMRLMHSSSSKQLRKLLGFAKDSAGGLMTTEYLFLSEEATVGDAINLIKKSVDYPGNIYHVYIVDEDNRLIGVTSLRRFINCDENMPLLDTCYTNNIFVRTDDEMEEIALLLEKYKFSSIPVLNEEDILQGVITSDDVMEELISLTWKKYKDQL